MGGRFRLMIRLMDAFIYSSIHVLNSCLRATCPPNQPTTADVFQEFGARWVRADPPNVMAFPPIFEELKVATRRRLRLARGDLSLWALWP